MLTVTLTRVSPTHHRFACTRDDGSSETIELETKSCLFHDLLHFALETEVGLQKSFYGLLASGVTYVQLTEGSLPDGGKEIAITERIVGGLTGFIKQDASPAQFLEALRGLFLAYGDSLPAWLTEERIERIRKRMRHLLGEWDALPFGQSMTLTFPESTAHASEARYLT